MRKWPARAKTEIVPDQELRREITAPQPGQPVQLDLERVRRIDVVCRRTHATIEFGGSAGGGAPILWASTSNQTASATPTHLPPQQEAGTAASCGEIDTTDLYRDNVGQCSCRTSGVAWGRVA